MIPPGKDLQRNRATSCLLMKVMSLIKEEQIPQEHTQLSLTTTKKGSNPAISIMWLKGHTEATRFPFLLSPLGIRSSSALKKFTEV